jgi:capsular polysaccharide biosynthesis protein
VIGLLCGVGLALIRETLRRTIRTPQDVEDQLQLPVLGLIPKGA